MYKFLVLFALGVCSVLNAQEARLLRFPTIHDNVIAFSYAGNLYSVPASGGVARRLTSHTGNELFARFSPDGKHLAFSGQYDGNTEIYLMPAQGGEPKRLTHTATLGRDDVSDRMGPNNVCIGWKGNDSIIYRSRWREFNDFKGQLYLVPVKGGLSRQLPFNHGGFCSYAPDGNRLAYNHVFREFRTWKRYAGGMADDIRIFDFATKKSERITNNPNQDIIPMWVGDRIYYLSDREKRMNLYAYDTKTRQTTQVTNFTEFDCKFPSHNGQWIVFENGGFIYKLNTATDRYEKLTIQIQEDLSAGRDQLVNVRDYIESWEIGPDGNRAVYVARGDVFTVPAKNGATRNLTQSSGAHDRNASWSPDGKYIAYISDQTGEDEIYMVSSDGRSAPVQLTQKGDNYKYGIEWSPDSKKLVYANRKQQLFVVDVTTRAQTLLYASPVFEISQYTWSPDSRYIAYTQPERKGNSSIALYDLQTGKTAPVTELWFQSFSPAFSSDGKYLFFVSERSFSPRYNNLEWNHAYFDLGKIYMVPLRKEFPNPFDPKSDEVVVNSEPEKSAASPASGKSQKDKKTKEEKTASSDTAKTGVEIEFEGIFDRVIELPGSAGNYYGLKSVGDRLYYFKNALGEETRWLVYDLKARKETELSNSVYGAAFSPDGKKVMVSSRNAQYIIDAPTSKVQLESPLDLGGLQLKLQRKAEWSQIFYESWRQMRDFVYAPNLHGVDWVGLRNTYAQLLPHVNHRADLSYVIGELIGELNLGHAYVGGGDYPKADRIALGLLGAELSRDASGYFRIDRILKGQNWSKSLRSPLAEHGKNVREGNYIVAVDGKSVKEVPDLYELLVGKADKQVVLKINSTPVEHGARELTVVPIADEHNLYYYNWVQKNIEKVDKATNGRVGYLHIPNMGPDGLNEFVKHFYPQLLKEAIIIDDRGNGGGNVSPQIIERLRREPVQVVVARNGAPSFEPVEQIVGPKIALIDEYSASDGDIFAYRFRKHQLGPIIGKRSWGGVVGIRGSLPIVDKGYLNRPEFSRYNVEGTQWEIEGYGVDPDIAIENDPNEAYMGKDAQLDKAIERMMEMIKDKRFSEPPPPPYPVK
ncbi:MAG: PD40 domain-containing protein [Saprospiraceae bacterium]|nr:PD40 domain-containing protein [Saprospiraceae bacterium]